MIGVVERVVDNVAFNMHGVSGILHFVKHDPSPSSYILFGPIFFPLFLYDWTLDI